MHFVVTTAGQEAIAGSLSPIVLESFTLGDGFGYTPNVSQVALQGSTLTSGVPSEPIIVSNNLLKYTIVLGGDLGTFAFGEVALYMPGGALFAIGVNDVPILKNATSPSARGNEVVVDAYITTNGTNYTIYAEYGNSSNPMNLMALPGVDSLPTAASAFPNVVMCGSPDQEGSVLAYSNNALWSIAGYEEIISSGTIISATANSVGLSEAITAPWYPGEYVVQFTSGVNLGVCRVVSGYNATGHLCSLYSVMTTLPQLNDDYQILRKTRLRPYIAALLNGLSQTLTATSVNPLELYNLAHFIHKSGNVAMAAPLSMGSFRIINVSDPTNASDAATKAYVDAASGSTGGDVTALTAAVANLNNTYFRKDGSYPMTGALNLSGNRIQNVPTPTAPGDGVNKGYVDTLVDGLSGGIVSAHASLTGLQGGAPGSMYHLTLAQHTFLTGLATNGLPAASTSQVGVSAFATSTEAGLGVSSSKAITPNALRVAIQDTGGPNSLQTSILNLLGLYGTNILRTGSGAPSGATAAHPPLYSDISTTPHTLYAYYLATWYPVNPAASTTTAGVIEIATQLEVDAGTDTTRAIVPATLAARLSGYSTGGDQPTGGGTDKVFFLNDQDVTTDFTIPPGKNALSAGPIATAPGVTVTTSPGSRWAVV